MQPTTARMYTGVHRQNWRGCSAGGDSATPTGRWATSDEYPQLHTAPCRAGIGAATGVSRSERIVVRVDGAGSPARRDRPPLHRRTGALGGFPPTPRVGPRSRLSHLAVAPAVEAGGGIRDYADLARIKDLLIRAAGVPGDRAPRTPAFRRALDEL